MLIEGRSIPSQDVLCADVCIIGGGVAGIFLALQLERQSLSVIVVEAGGASATGGEQTLYEGESVGIPYDLKDSRTRRLGGSSNCWGGFVRPPEPHLMQSRPWMAEPGWPITIDALRDYYQQVTHFHGLDEDELLSPCIETSSSWLLPQLDNIGVSVAQIVHKRRKFGQYFRRKLRRSARIRVLLRSTVSKLLTSTSGRRILGVSVVTEPDYRFFVRSAIVILAAGGIENARLLLLSRDRQSCGIGNDYDTVGRYFMDHPRVDLARVSTKNRMINWKLYDSQYAVHSLSKCLSLCVQPRTQIREQITGASCFLEAEVIGEGSAASGSL